MADFNVDAVQALRSKLLKILTSSDTSTGYYLSFVSGGFPQSDYTLQFLTDPSAIDQAFAFSYLANTVPVSTGDFSLSGTVIWDKYADWLNRYTPPPFSLTPDEQAKLAGAETYIDENYVDYVTYQGAWQNTYFDWQTLVVMPKADRPANYATLLAKAKAAMDTAKKSWDVLGHRSTFEKNYAIVQDLSERDPVITKQRLKDKLGSPLNAPGGDYYPTILRLRIFSILHSSGRTSPSLRMKRTSTARTIHAVGAEMSASGLFSGPPPQEPMGGRSITKNRRIPRVCLWSSICCERRSSAPGSRHTFSSVRVGNGPTRRKIIRPEEIPSPMAIFQPPGTGK